MSGLPHGELVLKDTGMFPITWMKFTFLNFNFNLILTNRRLIFTAGRFQDVIGSVLSFHIYIFYIPLKLITNL